MSMRIPKPSKQQLKGAIDEWNRNVPIGTAVEVQHDDGSLKETKTQSLAWLLGGHTPVVKLEGISGCYALGRIHTLPRLHPRP
jgi:hypothetical protein